MSLLGRVAARNLHTTSISARGPLTFDGWYPRDHKPGQLPTTEEERRAAAIQYGLRPEDYKTINPSDAVRHAGSYPDLGAVTFDHKDPYDAWTDRLHRRNWGEMVPIDQMTHRGDRLTFTGLEEEDFKPWKAFITCLRVLIPMGLLTWYFTRDDPNCFRWQNPVMPKQYAQDYYRAWPFGNPKDYPIVNYTFEPVQ